MLAKEEKPDDPSSMYEPDSVKTFLELLFSMFRTQGILIQQKDFNSMPMSYREYWRKLFDFTLKVRTDYATAKNRASTDPDDEQKIRSGPLTCFDHGNPKSHFRIMYYRVCRDVNYRMEEVSVLDSIATALHSH